MLGARGRGFATAWRQRIRPRVQCNVAANGNAALVAVIAGYVDHLMDGIGVTLITSYDQLTEALRRRRVQADPSDRFVERLFGLELTQAQYDRGSAFVDGVVERAGTDGLARLWHSERELPTPAEVDAPGLWLARIELEPDPGN